MLQITPEPRLDPPEYPEHTFKCDFCGDPIYDGDIYGAVDGWNACKECMEGNWDCKETKDKFELLGYTVKLGSYEED